VKPPKKRGGKRAKSIGYYHEKKMEAALVPYGFYRMVMSGALGGDHAGDLRRPAGHEKAVHVVEVKRRAGGQQLIRRWLEQGGADCLLLPGDRGQDAIVVLTLDHLCALLAEAGYRGAPPSTP